MLFKKKKKDFVFESFKSQIESKGMRIDSVDETGLICISQGELTFEISLDNVRKNYEKDQDEKHISGLVQVIISHTIKVPSTWEEVKDQIFISLFPNDCEFGDFIHFKVTDGFSKIFVYSARDSETWITSNDLEKWKINESDLENQANKNADNLLKNVTIAIDVIENRKFGMIESEEPTLKAALLFAPAMKDKIEKDFGFPFYAVFPVRDYCLIFSEDDFEFLAGIIGYTVVREYKESGYPITTEILKFTDQGVEAVGKYPVN